MIKSILGILLILIPGILYAQHKKADEIREIFWGNADKYKKHNSIPVKWNNESAVIIYQEYNYKYKGTSKAINYVESIRQRIKLQDKAAVEEFSEFSFAEKFNVTKGFSFFKKGKMFMGVKIIKPDGAVKEIDLEEAKEIENSNGANLKKIAIPNLEEGDIIDFYYYVHEPFYTVADHIFEPIITTLNGKYPIMKQRISFDVGKDFFINFRSVHGAPKLSAIDNPSNKSVSYVLEDEYRENREDYRWFYPKRSLPIIKFQVVYARKHAIEKNVNAFIGEKGKVKTTVNKSDIIEFYNSNRRLYFNISDTYLNKYLKQKGLYQSNDKIKLIKAAYYYMRHHSLMLKMEPITLLQGGVEKSILSSYGNFLNETGFVRKFGSFLKENNIDFDVILSVPREYSSIEDLLLKQEVSLLIRVNLKKPIYIYNFNIHSNYDEIPAYLEGTKAYVLKVSPKYKIERIDSLTIPVSSHKDNTTVAKLEISFDNESFNILKIKRENTFTGHNKVTNQNVMIDLYDYIGGEYKKYGTESYIDRVDYIKKKQKEVLRKGIEAKKKEDKIEQKERFKKNAETEFELETISYDSYNIKSFGRTAFESSFSFNESFKVEGITQKAGKNYILQIGKFIGAQIGLEKKEIDRKYDIYMPFARSYKYEITFHVPDGYEVKGVEGLNMKIENETGGFESKSWLENGKLYINTFKYYAHNFEKVEDWPKMVYFLEAAYQFTQQKVLLKKVKSEK